MFRNFINKIKDLYILRVYEINTVLIFYASFNGFVDLGNIEGADVWILCAILITPFICAPNVIAYILRIINIKKQKTILFVFELIFNIISVISIIIFIKVFGFNGLLWWLCIICCVFLIVLNVMKILKLRSDKIHCNKCGTKNENISKYCVNCGNNLSDNGYNDYNNQTQNVNIYSNNIDSINQQTNLETSISSSVISNESINPKKNKFSKSSEIIGIISLILVFIFQIFTIPLSIVGLVLGVKGKKLDATKKKGIILNTISLALAILF